MRRPAMSLPTQSLSKRLRLSPRARPKTVLALCVSLAALTLMAWHFGGGTVDGDVRCRWGCASALLASTRSRLQAAFAEPSPGLKLRATPVFDARHPHVLATCSGCDCDVCGWLLGVGSFGAPVC
jgi:hypothetical protein